MSDKYCLCKGDIIADELSKKKCSGESAKKERRVLESVCTKDRQIGLDEFVEIANGDAFFVTDAAQNLRATAAILLPTNSRAHASRNHTQNYRLIGILSPPVLCFENIVHLNRSFFNLESDQCFLEGLTE